MKTTHKDTQRLRAWRGFVYILPLLLCVLILGIAQPVFAQALLFYEQNETDASNTLSELTLFESGTCGSAGVSQQTLWVCLPSGSTCDTSSAPTLDEGGGDTENRLTTSPQNFSTMGTTGCCANVQFSMAADDVVNSYYTLTVTGKHTGFDDTGFTVNFKDNDLERADWGWELDESPVTLVTDHLITGRVIIDANRVSTLCHLHLEFMDDDDGSFGTNTSSPYYIDPATCPPSPDKCICTESSWHLKYDNGSTMGTEQVDFYYPNIPSQVPLLLYPDGYSGTTPFTVVWDEGDCYPALCVKSTNERDGLTYPNCETISPPAVQFFMPTFVMTASYDWLHNFYDHNQDADGTNSDPDTDNFNKIITIDSNLFPIHTALDGDQEFPNIAMRNWTSGAGVTSPSVNDYMNRSVAAVANYIPYTTRTYYEYGETDGVKVLGSRSYIQWVYALDPANNNFRRYKYSKIPDNFRPPLLMDNKPEGDVMLLSEIETTEETTIQQCPDCYDCYWYVGTTEETLCSDNSSDYCCTSDALSVSNNSYCQDPGAVEAPIEYTEKQEWAFISQDPSVNKCSGLTQSVSYPDCDSDNFPTPDNSAIPTNDTNTTGAPRIRIPVLLTLSDYDQASDTFDVTVTIQGHTHDNNSGLAFVLNLDEDATTCQRSVAVSGGSGSDDLQFLSNANLTCDECEKTYTYGDDASETAFQDVPASCLQTDYADETYIGYMTVDVYPCGGDGIIFQIPAPPTGQDNAFTVASLEETDPTAWAALSSSEQAYYSGDGRWVSIGGYLDTVPPKSYPGYAEYNTAATRTVGYGTKSNTIFDSATSIRFKNPRDIDVFRDYYDVQNEGPVYIFVADTMNSRVQVFMNATASAGEVGASFPIRPVPVKGPQDDAVAFTTNELGLRIDSDGDGDGDLPGDGRRADFRGYTTVDGASWSSSKIPEASSTVQSGTGEFFYPHSIAVDQDPDTKDVYLFVADTYNHRIQVFRDLSGVSSQDITDKRFDFEYETAWGSYPLQTSMGLTPPGPFNYRYPKGLDVVRFGNNSSYLYVVDSKDYRVMKYEILEDPAGGIRSISALSGLGYDSANSTFDDTLTNAMGGTPPATEAGFINPQDVATGYSGFFKADVSGTEKTVFLNNYMVYVTDYARNNTVAAETTDAQTDQLNIREMQFLDIPGSTNLHNIPIPWRTTDVPFGSYTTDNLALGQSVFGIYGGVHNSTGSTTNQQGASNNIPGAANLFSERPVGLAALQWNTFKPMDIRVVPYDSDSDSSADAYEPMVDPLPVNDALRIGVSSRVLRFQAPLDKAKGFWNASTLDNDFDIDMLGRWDAMKSGRVHFFCYNSSGVFTDHTALQPPTQYDIDNNTKPLSYQIQLDDISCSSGGFVKIVAEDADFGYSGRSGTIFYELE